MPKGTKLYLFRVITVIFSYFGAEIAAIAASSNRENPAKAITTAIRSVVWRILIFYIGSVAILRNSLSWNSADLLKSPYCINASKWSIFQQLDKLWRI